MEDTSESKASKHPARVAWLIAAALRCSWSFAGCGGDDDGGSGGEGP